MLQLPHWSGTVFACGDAGILKHHKTAFLCSRRYSAQVVLRIYDWAKKMREDGKCVISGFHSVLEQDVRDILLEGSQPVILAAARGLPQRYNVGIKKALACGRLLVLSPFPGSVHRITAKTAHKRNQFMLCIADQIVVGCVSEKGILAEDLSSVASGKEVIRLDEP